jgi:regulator of sigma D
MEQQAAAARAAADPAQAQKAREQVRMLLHERFAVHQQMAELEIKRQMAELEKALDARAKDEDKLVDNELNHMLPPPPPPPKPAPPK